MFSFHCKLGLLRISTGLDSETHVYSLWVRKSSATSAGSSASRRITHTIESLSGPYIVLDNQAMGIIGDGLEILKLVNMGSLMIPTQS
jgi:hypothetical protein